MKKVLAIAALSLCLAPASNAAENCKDDPVALGHIKFEEQVKKAAYDLVLIAEPKSAPATPKKDADAEFFSRGVIYSKADGRAFVPKAATDQVLVKVVKKKGSPDIVPGKPYALYLHKEKDKWVLGPCSHTHTIMGTRPADVEAEQWYVNKAYGLPNARKTAPPIPGAPAPTAIPLDPLPAPKEAPKNLPTPPGMGEFATGPDSAPKPPPAPGTTPVDLKANQAPIATPPGAGTKTPPAPGATPPGAGTKTPPTPGAAPAASPAPAKKDTKK